ncbi:amidase [Triangularia verruculosa]|uniref:Amidase n=1 Tax=Triangularia verruculosa TaxID=2587418 RepID=A0AAN6XIN6_9PEZI|nr:amidase [Triangularia verruculosa]
MADALDALLTNVAGLPYHVPAAPLLAPSRSRTVFQSTGNTHGNSTNSSPSWTARPATLFVFNSNRDLTAEQLQSKVNDWLKLDDVFNENFLRRVYFLFPAEPEASEVSDEVEGVLSSWGSSTAHIISLGPQDDAANWRAGPYFASTQGLRQVWRLFLIHTKHLCFLLFQATMMHRGTSGVPVSSRAYYDAPSEDKRLSGIRVVVKDVIDMAGVPTFAGNKAYGALYGAKAKNAACVEKLLDAGAVLLGKVKTVQFASGANGKDWFDYQPPFNPRGDGYQDPGCSSAGSATAASAYDWIDVAIGTDTFGSVIGPASEHGVFGLHSSFGSVSTVGVVPLSKELDTVGFFSKSAQTAAATIRAMAQVNISKRFCSSNITLVYPTDFFADWPPEYLSATDGFIRQLEEFLHTEREHIGIGSSFIEGRVAGGKSMQAYLRNTTAHIQLYDCYRNCLPFLEEYKAKFGKMLFADPYIQYKWKLGRDLTDEEYAVAIRQRDIFKEWILTKILPQGQEGQDFDKILLLPNGYMDPFYSHEYDGRTLEEGAHRKQGFGFKDTTLAVLAGLPVFNIPITQFPYQSSVSRTTEFLPGNIALVGQQGSEVALLKMMARFLSSSKDLRDSVATGSVPFPG